MVGRRKLYGKSKGILNSRAAKSVKESMFREVVRRRKGEILCLSEFFRKADRLTETAMSAAGSRSPALGGGRQAGQAHSLITHWALHPPVSMTYGDPACPGLLP